MTRVVDPAIADLQHELRMHPGARGIRWAAYLAVWKALTLAATLSLAGGLARWTMRDPRTIGRTAGLASAVALPVTVALTLPPVFDTPMPLDAATRARMFAYLVPQALAVAIPWGLTFGIVFSLRGRSYSRHTVQSMALLACVFSAAAFVVMDWLTPDANQAFRELFARGPIPRGANETRLADLLRRGDPYSVHAIHLRLALTVAPVSLAALALAVAAFVRSRRAAAAAGLGLPILYGACLWLANPGTTSSTAILALWLPNIAVTLLAVLLLARARRSALPMLSHGS